MRPPLRIPTGLALALGAMLLLPAPATADTLHAAPDGAGTTCSASAPCELEAAVEELAVGGDIVVVHPGSYDLGLEQLGVPFDVTVRGRGPGRRPIISSSCCENPGVASTAVVVGRAAVVRDLQVVHPGGLNGGVALEIPPTNGVPGTAERVVAIAPTVGCSVAPGEVPTYPPPVVRDSACVSTGPGGPAVTMNVFPGDLQHAADLSGVTAYALGQGAVGLRVGANGTGTGEVAARVGNSIIAGDTVDVRTVEADDLAATAVLTHSNYATTDSASGGTITPPGTVGNQTDPPLLVDPAAFDFTQRPGSPTIDAGDDLEALGEFDVEGNPRIFGPAVDIGAHERLSRCAGKLPTIVATPGVATVGTRGRDVIVGTSGPDVIRARGGRDVICSLGGNDRVNGGGGKRDMIFGQGGKDRLRGGAGPRDLCHGGGGRDSAARSCERVRGTP